jgi:hypothetical protein
MGTPSRTAIRAAALSSALRVRIVDGLQGSRLLPLASRLRRVRPLMWASMSRLRPSGNFSHSGSSVVLIAGSRSRRSGQPSITPMHPFQALAMLRRAPASVASAVVSAR